MGIKVVEYIPPTHVGPDGEMDPARKPTTVIQPINPDSISKLSYKYFMVGGFQIFVCKMHV